MTPAGHRYFSHSVSLRADELSSRAQEKHNKIDIILRQGKWQHRCFAIDMIPWARTTDTKKKSREVSCWWFSSSAREEWRYSSKTTFRASFQHNWRCVTSATDDDEQNAILTLDFNSIRVYDSL